MTTSYYCPDHTRSRSSRHNCSCSFQVRNFQVLDERDCQMAWAFDHWGPFGRQRRAWPHGVDSPHFHMHTGKIGLFFRSMGFPLTQVGLCVDGPHMPAGHLQNTPGRPAIHFPLAASGSQSALYLSPGLIVNRPHSMDPCCYRFSMTMNPRP